MTKSPHTPVNRTTYKSILRSPCSLGFDSDTSGAASFSLSLHGDAAAGWIHPETWKHAHMLESVTVEQTERRTRSVSESLLELHDLFCFSPNKSLDLQRMWLFTECMSLWTHLVGGNSVRAELYLFKDSSRFPAQRRNNPVLHNSKLWASGAGRLSHSTKHFNLPTQTSTRLKALFVNVCI